MDMTYFNAEKTRDELVDWIRDWFDRNGPTSNMVIGISGGKDSTIVAGLGVRALGKERVIGVMMPNGEQKDIEDSRRVCEALGIRNITVNIQDAYLGIAEEVEDKIVFDLGIKGLSEQTKINIAPRLRMTTLYAVAQSVNGRVVNTSNKSECYVGYGTIYGDLAGSFYPLKNLTKTEVVEIGKTMSEIPIDLIVKTPSDGLIGKSDEDSLGFTYDEVDMMIRNGIKGEHYGEINERHNKNLFKSRPFEEFQYFGG